MYTRSFDSTLVVLVDPCTRVRDTDGTPLETGASFFSRGVVDGCPKGCAKVVGWVWCGGGSVNGQPTWQIRYFISAVLLVL